MTRLGVEVSKQCDLPPYRLGGIPAFGQDFNRAPSNRQHSSNRAVVRTFIVITAVAVAVAVAASVVGAQHARQAKVTNFVRVRAVNKNVPSSQVAMTRKGKKGCGGIGRGASASGQLFYADVTAREMPIRVRVGTCVCKHARTQKFRSDRLNCKVKKRKLFKLKSLVQTRTQSFVLTGTPFLLPHLKQSQSQSQYQSA